MTRRCFLATLPLAAVGCAPERRTDLQFSEFIRRNNDATYYIQNAARNGFYEQAASPASQAVNRFSLTLLGQLHAAAPTRTILLAPPALYLSLAMLEPLERGDARRAFRDTFLVPPQFAPTAWETSVGSLIEALTKQAGDVLRWGASLWADSAQSLNPKFAARCLMVYHGRATTAPLTAPETRVTIQRWCQEKLGAPSSPLVTVPPLSPPPAAMLTSVARLTLPRPATGAWPAVAGKHYRGVLLSYPQTTCHCFFLTPRQGSTWEAMCAELLENHLRWTRNPEAEGTVTATLPALSTTETLDLTTTLSALPLDLTTLGFPATARLAPVLHRVQLSPSQKRAPQAGASAREHLSFERSTLVLVTEQRSGAILLAGKLAPP